MKLVKSDRRTLMTEKTLSNALMIKLEGPTIKSSTLTQQLTFGLISVKEGQVPQGLKKIRQV